VPQRHANFIAQALAASILLVIAPASVHAAQTQGANAPQSSVTPEPSPAPYSSESPKPDLLDGTLSAKGELEADEQLTEATAPSNPLLAAKKSFEERSGVTFGMAGGVLYQNFSNPTLLQNQFQAVGGKFAFDLNAPLANRDKPNALTFDMAVEARGPLASDFPPLQAGVLAGSGVPTAATWGEFNLGVTQAYIRQSLAGNKFQYTVGKIFAPNYVDAYPLFDDNRQFLNLAFSTNPTIAVPLRGFGFVGAGFPGSGNLYLTGGMFTANSSDTGSTIGDFFSRNEHFYFLEVGQTSFARAGFPIQGRGAFDRNNIHVTLWYRDALTPRGPDDAFLRPAPEAYGAAFNMNQAVGEGILWFLRAGIGKGSLFGTGAIASGFAWRPTYAPRDLFGFAVGWTNPQPPVVDPLPIPAPFPISIPNLRSQGTGEIFYRIALIPNFALTPDYELLIHPSLAPSRGSISVFSLRGRLTL
jgi:porin